MSQPSVAFRIIASSSFLPITWRCTSRRVFIAGALRRREVLRVDFRGLKAGDAVVVVPIRFAGFEMAGHLTKSVAAETFDAFIDDAAAVFLQTFCSAESGWQDSESGGEVAACHYFGMVRSILLTGVPVHLRGRAEIFRIAGDDDHCYELRGVQTFFRYAQDVCGRDLSDGFLELKDKVIRGSRSSGSAPCGSESSMACRRRRRIRSERCPRADFSSAFWWTASLRILLMTSALIA